MRGHPERRIWPERCAPALLSSLLPLVGSDEDPPALIAAEDHVRRLALDAGHFGGRQGEVTAAAPAPRLEAGRGHTAELRPQLVVQLDEVGGQPRRSLAP